MEPSLFLLFSKFSNTEICNYLWNSTPPGVHQLFFHSELICKYQCKLVGHKMVWYCTCAPGKVILQPWDHSFEVCKKCVVCIFPFLKTFILMVLNLCNR